MAFQNARVIVRFPPIFGYAQRRDSSFLYGQFGIGDDFCQIHCIARAQSAAAGAHALWAVEREQLRYRLLRAAPACRTGKVRAQQEVILALCADDDRPFAHDETGIDGFADAPPHCFFCDHPIYYDFDIVSFVAFQFRGLGQCCDLSIHARTDIALFLQIFKQVVILSFSPLYERRENVNARAFTQCHNLIYYAVAGLRPDWRVVLRTMGGANSRK